MPPIQIYQGNQNDGREAFDTYPQNVLINPKPGEEHLEMIPGLTEVIQGFGVSRGGQFCQTDTERGTFRVLGKHFALHKSLNELVKLNIHKIPVFEIDAKADKTQLVKGDTATVTIEYGRGEGSRSTEFDAGQLPSDVTITKVLDTDTETRYTITAGNAGILQVKFTSKDANNTIEYYFDFRFVDQGPIDPLPVSLHRETDAREEEVYIDGEGFAKITPTNNNIAITTDNKQYLYNSEFGLRLNKADLIGKPKDTAFMNERLVDIGEDKDNSIVYVVQHVAGKDDEIRPLAYGTSDAEPDEIIGLERNTGNYLYIFNRFTIETFIDQGGETDTNQFTLRRQQQSEIQGGLVATNLKVNIGGTYCFIGGKKSEPIAFHVIESGRLKQISTADINLKLATYTQAQLDASWLEFISLGGHKLIICQLPDQTIAHDLSTGGWCTFKTGINYDKNPWRASHVVYDHDMGLHLVGDKSNSTIGKLDKSTFQQYGEDQEVVAYSQRYNFSNRGVIMRSLFLETIAGEFDNNYVQRLYIAESTQGGRIFSNEDERVVAANGEYARYFLFRGLGHHRGRVAFRLRMTGPYRLSLGQSLIFNEEP